MNYDIYRDKNNFVRHNKAMIGDRLGFNKESDIHDFVDVRSENIYYGAK